MRPVIVLLAAAALPAQTVLDTATLARDVIASEIKNFDGLGEYTFQFESTIRTFKRNNRQDTQVTRTGESYMSHRRNIDIVLTRDGVPLQPKDLERQRTSARKKMEADIALRQAAANKPIPPDSRAGPGFQLNAVRMSAVDVLRYCRLAPRVANAEEWILDFSACKSPWPAEAHYPKMKGEIRLDVKSRRVVSWRAATLDGTPVFEYTTQLAPDGVRLMAVSHASFHAAPDVFPDRIETIYRWTNPQRFLVDVQQTISTPDPK